MPFWKTILGLNVKRFPYECTVEYEFGGEGKFPIWACDMRDCLKVLRDLMPEHKPAISLLIVRRDVVQTGETDAA